MIARDAAVLHDFPGEGFNLDDVVVHPSGVYYVETKTLSKPLKGQAKLFFDGDSVLFHSLRGVMLSWPSRNPLAVVEVNVVTNILMLYSRLCRLSFWVCTNTCMIAKIYTV